MWAGNASSGGHGLGEAEIKPLGAEGRVVVKLSVLVYPYAITPARVLTMYEGVRTFRSW